jgi:hypothetical protein
MHVYAHNVIGVVDISIYLSKMGVVLLKNAGSQDNSALLPENGRSLEPVEFPNVNAARSTRADMQRIPHLITSSARVSMVGGTSTRSPLRSAGFDVVDCYLSERQCASPGRGCVNRRPNLTP